MRGFPHIPDMNDQDNSDIDWSHTPVTRDASGHRLSTAQVFLSPGVLLTHHVNLHGCPHAMADHLFSVGKGSKRKI